MFTLQSRILWPLYIVGTCCRHPLIRREAADLLLLYDCQEGPWRADCIVQCIYTFAKIEEAGLSGARRSSDVPRQNRVSPAKGTLLGSNEYMPLSNEKRDKAIRWLQVDYNTHGPRLESAQKRRSHLELWSPSLPLSFAMRDKAAGEVFDYHPPKSPQPRRSDLEVLFVCNLDLATICRCI